MNLEFVFRNLLRCDVARFRLSLMFVSMNAL
jgi:hypothetical protein